jgi:hypothetical protein
LQSTTLADHYITNALGGASAMTATDLLAMGDIAGGINSDHIANFDKAAYWSVRTEGLDGGEGDVVGVEWGGGYIIYEKHRTRHQQ